MSDDAVTFDRLEAELTAQYPALADRERYAALWELASTYMRWDEATYQGLIGRLRLNIWDVDRANTLAEIEIEYKQTLERLNEDYIRRLREVQGDHYAALQECDLEASKKFAHAAHKWTHDKGQIR